MTAASDTVSAPESTPEPPSVSFERRRRLSRVSIQSKLLIMLLLTSILSAAVVGFIGYQSGRNSIRAAVFDRLIEVREMQTRQLQASLADLSNSLVIYTRGTTTTNAVRDFTKGFDELADKPITPAQQTAIDDYYHGVFAKDYHDRTGADLHVDGLLPTSNPQKYLQAHYTTPFNDWNAALANDDAHDGSAWSAANLRYNDFFREIVNRFKFEDALLLDTRGNVVYSAYKGVDLGTNILTGPYRGDNLREAYQKAVDANTVDYVGVTDFGQYTPTGDPTAWMVSPVGSEGRVEGVVALQFPITKVNQSMTANRQWDQYGMGQTGETILVGADGLMRSDSRLFLENPDDYKRDVTAAGTPERIAEQAIRQGGTTLIQPVPTDATRRAQQGQSGTMIERDYLGQETLQAYAPANIPGLDWSVIAKVDTDEAFAPVAAFTRNLVLSTAGIIFLVCLASMLLSRLFVRPIRKLEAGARQISAGDYGATVEVTSRDEFGDLTVAFNGMSRNLAIKEDLLNEQRQENDRLLLSMMPESVAERYRDGEENIAQDHKDVTVVFADIVGLNQLAASLESPAQLAILNRLVREFDAAAVDLGVEKVRTLHNGYLASCGLNVPRLDNVRRTLDFAAEMQRIVDRIAEETGLDLRVRAGIDTGTVTSGLVGRTSLAYDMWGAAVNIAYQVQSGTPQPGVYVTTRVHGALRDIREFTEAGSVWVDGNEEPVWRLSDGGWRP